MLFIILNVLSIVCSITGALPPFKDDFTFSIFGAMFWLIAWIILWGENARIRRKYH